MVRTFKTDHSGRGTSWKKCSRLGVCELEGINSGVSVQISAEALRNLFPKRCKNYVGKDLLKY